MASNLPQTLWGAGSGRRNGKTEEWKDRGEGERNGKCRGRNVKTGERVG